MNIKKIVIRILEENGIGINDEGGFLNMDSISFISAIVSIEQEFEIEFPDEFLMLSRLDSVKKLVEIIEENVKK